MTPVRVFFLDNEILIDTVPAALVAGSLQASLGDDGTVTIARLQSAFALAAVPWQVVAAQDGSTFATSDAVMTYLASQFTMRRPVGSPQRNYALALSDGQTVFPITPAPIDVNTIGLVVNGHLYAPPDITVSALAVTWQGAFDLAATDAVRVIYF